MTDKKAMAKNRWMIDPDDAVMLLLDHQSGLLQLVHDIDQSVLRHNVTALAKVAWLSGIPTFTTTFVPDSANGPLIPEIHLGNPDAVYISRTGEINAWDDVEWVRAIEGTGRKTLIIAGILTSICMALPALSAVEAGYRVFCVLDASGNRNQIATEITIARIVQAGVMPIDTCAVVAELMGTWNRPDAMDFAAIMVDHIVPSYRTLMESYDKARSVQMYGRETTLDKMEPTSIIE